MAQFEERALFGGAITGAAPQGWIDASNIREVPDHQEVFLSPTTLSNLIIEINEYQGGGVGGGALGSAPNIELATSVRVDADAEDSAATLHHLLDICDDDDTMEVTKGPQKVQLKNIDNDDSAKNHHVSALSGVAKFTSPRKGTDDRSTNNCHFLLVRLPTKRTDLLVLVNVPRDEFDAKGDASALAREEELASGLISRFVDVLSIKDWGLFGSS